jgi:hypothetical protein
VSITQNKTAPTAAITNNSGTTVLTCTTSSISLTATGGTSYSWSDGTSVVGTNANLMVTTPGTYTVTVTAANGCTATASVSITKEDNVPTAAITNNTGTTVLTCTTSSISLTATGGTSYSWSDGTNVVGTNANLTVTTPGTYTVTVTAANGCTATASVSITKEDNVPIATITNNTGTTVLTCTTSSISLTATGGTSYSWSDGTNVVGTNANLTVTTPGTYTVTVSAANGCTGSAIINISIEEQVKPIFTQLGPYCVKDTPGVLPSRSKEGIQGTWSPALINTASAGSTFYTFTPDPDECAESVTMTIVVTTCQTTDFCTYSIGFYGNRSGSVCIGGKETNASGIMSSVLSDAGGYYTFGSELMNFTLFRFDISLGNIFKILPGGGPAKAFTGSSSYVIKSTWKYAPLSERRIGGGRSQNNLFSQLLAFYFNLNINPGLASFKIENFVMGTIPIDCNSNEVIPDSDESYYSFPESILNYMRSSSVYSADGAGLFNLANDAIGGKITNVNLNDLATALAFMNEGFNECRSLVAWYHNVPEKIWTTISDFSKPVLTVYPNPFNERVIFETEFGSAGKVLLEIFDIKGIKVKTVYNNQVEAGMVYRFEYLPEGIAPGILFYRLVKDDKVYTGKLIYK